MTDENEINYEVYFGDGSPAHSFSGAQIAHQYPDGGDYWLEVRALSDKQNRKYPEYYTRRLLSGEGFKDFNPSVLPAIFHILLH